ncbi:antitermination protein [Rosenbergiella gaditana]|uniref:transcriptional antitermination N peptide n=1 Tax=Rosenbergiella gaditana TaxID=2726987 RepID=UPI001BD98A23|nr:antitermination protein [Rosenbergiella gaditana]
MIPAQNLKSTARTRRDEKRKAKQMAFAAANPTMVGRSYQDIGETITPVQRPGYEPKPLILVAASAKRQVINYKNGIIRATYLYMHEFKRKPVVEGSICLEQVAIYAAGHRKSNQVTAR